MIKIKIIKVQKASKHIISLFSINKSKSNKVKKSQYRDKYRFIYFNLQKKDYFINNNAKLLKLNNLFKIWQTFEQ